MGTVLTIQRSLDLLTPQTNRKITVLIKMANHVGMDVYAFETLRTYQRQCYLYGLRRTAAECIKAGIDPAFATPNAPKLRTWTLKSKHLTGEAADITFDINHDPKIYNPSWQGDYKTLIWFAGMLGLRNLAPTETCHFEDDGSSLITVLVKNSARRVFADDRTRNMLHLANTLLK